MNSIGEECQQLKVAYDECFNRWIRDSFLQGKNDNSCDKLFETYQACVKVTFDPCIFAQTLRSYLIPEHVQIGYEFSK